jgi:serine/threonine protein kinase
MSPEQVEGARGGIDRPTDIYSLGILMFRLLTGEFPYQNRLEDQNRLGIVQEIRDGLTVVPSARRADLDSRIDRIFRLATERDPSRRYHSMNAMADDLGELLGFPTAPTVMRIQQLGERGASDPSPTVALSPSAGHLILARIPAGSFDMGSSEGYFGNETPVRRVTLTSCWAYSRSRRGSIAG